MFAFLLAFLGSFNMVHAESVCGDARLNTPDDPIVRHDCGNGSPELVMNIWGTTNSQIPHVKAGDVVYDEGGLPLPCPTITWKIGCVDISHTDYYRNKMIDTGRQLKNLGFSGGMFAYWINLAQ